MNNNRELIDALDCLRRAVMVTAPLTWREPDLSAPSRLVWHGEGRTLTLSTQAPEDVSPAGEGVWLSRTYEQTEGGERFTLSSLNNDDRRLLAGWLWLTSHRPVTTGDLSS